MSRSESVLSVCDHLSLVYLNGSYLPSEEARLSFSDRGLAYGDGVFTTVKVLGGAPQFLERHLRRLGRDAAAIGLPAPLGRVEAACFGLISRLDIEEGVLKTTLTRGTGARGLSTKSVALPTTIVSASSLPEIRPPLCAISVPDGRGALAAHKTLNYLPNVLAVKQAEEAGCDEAVFVRDGMLLEATASNLVGVVEDRLLTPPLECRVLGGVAREVLLEEGVVFEGALPTDISEPLYCINSVRGVEPVAKLDGRPLRFDPQARNLLDKILASRARPVS